MLANLWWLVVGHMVCDFSLQHDPMARGKNRHLPVDMSKLPPGVAAPTIWPWWLSAHALIHGGAVALILRSPTLGLAEAAAHWAIDFMKCEKVFGIHTDQVLHLACKVAWALLGAHTAA